MSYLSIAGQDDWVGTGSRTPTTSPGSTTSIPTYEQLTASEKAATDKAKYDKAYAEAYQKQLALNLTQAQAAEQLRNLMFGRTERPKSKLDWKLPAMAGVAVLALFVFMRRAP